MLTDRSGSMLAANNDFLLLVGRSRQTLIGFGPPHAWWPTREPSLLDALETDPHTHLVRETVIVGADGRRTTVEVTAASIQDPVNDVRGILWTFSDRSSSLLLRYQLDAVREVGLDEFRLLEMVRDPARGIVDGTVIDANERAATAIGIAREELIGTRLSALDPVNLDSWVREFRRVLSTGRPAEIEVRLDGATGERRLKTQLTPLGDAVAVVSRDVTAIREALEKARVATERFDFVAESAGDAITIQRPDGAFSFANDAVTQIWDREPSDLLGTDALIYVHPDDRARVSESFGEIAHGVRGDDALSYRILRPSGSVLTVDVSLRPVRSRSGELLGVACVARDAAPRFSAAAQADEQAALRRVATAAAVQSDSEAVMAIAASEVASLVEAEIAHVCRFDGGDRITTLGSSDAPDSEIAPLSEGQLTALRGVRETGKAFTAEATDTTSAVAAAAPVSVGERAWGAIVVSCGREDAPPDIELRLERFAELVAIAVTAAEGRAQLAAQAVTDPLTRLPNHRAFHEALRAEVARAVRHGRSLSLAVIDIDHFKRLNDIYGHQEGDRVLREVSDRLGAAVRAGEMVARVGGEEFAWILPETDIRGAGEAVERARAAISSRPLVGRERVTVSAGLCDLTHASAADELFRLADGALYWAKANGRNMACVYSPDVVDILSAEERAERLERGQALIALRVLARAVDAKDASTHAHSERVAQMSHDLALALGWPPERALKLRDAAMLHDVGKIGVPDAVLLKTGSLRPEEFEVIKRHAALGAEITSDALTAEQCLWIRHHHEHWNGRGYPDGLSSDEIPEGSRLISVADAWDVMTRARHYTTTRSIAGARREIGRCAGSQFWPQAVHALLTLPATAGNAPVSVAAR